MGVGGALLTALDPPVSSEHGFRAYLPLPREQRRGIGLCISGGGYRAALFHLGAFRRLDELGVLSKVDTFASVSGGSILLAQLATHRRALGDAWPAPGARVPRLEEAVAGPMEEFVRIDIRTRPALRGLDPRNWRNPNAAVDALAEHYADGPAPGRLSDLPPRPRFVFCATDLRFRTQWVFDAGRRRVGSDQAGYAELTDRWTLARAVAASSCLPPAFRPMRLEFDPRELTGGAYARRDRDDLVRQIDLTDGGVYDNLAIEPLWRDHAAVLVSDAAPSLTVVPPFGRLWASLRVVVTLLEQATDVRKRWLIHAFGADQLEGAYWGIGSFPAGYPDTRPIEGYSEDLIAETISQVRIDVDRFTEAEIGVLENHGYRMADIAVRRHAAGLTEPGAPDPAPPWPRWLDEDDARAALEHSDETKLFRRPRFLRPLRDYDHVARRRERAGARHHARRAGR